jgi:replicative DNA helicase
VRIFNLYGALKAGKPIFIVEGEIDAASIVEVGGSALALGSIAYVNRFFTELDAFILEHGKPEQPFIIALDNEKDPEKQARVDKAANNVEEGLRKRGLLSYRRNPCEGYKDANEALQKDRESLRSSVEAANNAGEKEREAYLQTSSAANLQSFIDGIAASVDTPCISTGFFNLDSMLDGGLYEGLYIMGAITSLGKTSLALQMCDQIAKAGTDVLIFSLEMARAELMAKSISRHTFIIAHEQYPAAKDAEKANRISKTGRGITDGKRYINYSKEERELINSAVKAYSEYAGHIFISEGVGDIGVDQIRETIERHIRITGRKPLILVDYLQILAPYSDRATDKQNTDKAVLELKRISRDFKTTVIAISSLNRMSYKDAISMEAFKESGAIEYSADCLIGLQLKGAGKKDFNATDEKKKDPRMIELIILKNRNAAVGDGATLEYYPRFNFFEEV